MLQCLEMSAPVLHMYLIGFGKKKIENLLKVLKINNVNYVKKIFISNT